MNFVAVQLCCLCKNIGVVFKKNKNYIRQLMYLSLTDFASAITTI